MLHVAFEELSPGVTNELLAGEPRRRMNQRHGVLQLIAETISTAGLIIAAAAPDSAGQGLVYQPAVGQHVECGVGRVDVDGTERAVPMVPHRFERLIGTHASAEALDQLPRVAYVTGCAEQEHDHAFLSRSELDASLDRGTWIEAGAGAPRQPLA